MDHAGRACAAPAGEDILGMLVREHGDELTDDELIGVAGLLLLAGHETTSNMLGSARWRCLRHPDQLAAVRDDPDAVGPAVEELLRWLSIVQTRDPAHRTTDVEVAGVTIPAGTGLPVAAVGQQGPWTSSTRPRVLDIRSRRAGHLAFGHGVHHCLGAPLARMEMRIAFPPCCAGSRARTRRGFRSCAFRTWNFIYGLKSLEVTW
jgi:cytochrome P450